MITTQTTMMMIAITVMSVESDEVTAGGDAGGIAMIGAGFKEVGVGSRDIDGDDRLDASVGVPSFEAGEEFGDDVG